MNATVIFDQHEIERADELTPITCLDCGGNWRRTIDRADGRHHTEYCKHCIRGGMNEEQMKAWREFKRQRRLDSALKEYMSPAKPQEFNIASSSTTGVRRKV